MTDDERKLLLMTAAAVAGLVEGQPMASLVTPDAVSILPGSSIVYRMGDLIVRIQRDAALPPSVI